MSDIIYTFPHVKTAGWDGTTSYEGLTPSKGMALYPDFFNPQDTDVMAVAYSIPGSTKFPRLNVGALAHMPENYRPVLNWVFFDVDNPGHAKWSCPGEAEEHLDSLPWNLDCLKDSGYYSTPGGYRLFWKLETPIPVTRANGFLKAWGEHVSKQTGIVIDPASYEWTRFFRVPRANRPGYGVLPEPAFDTAGQRTLDAYATGMVPDTDEVPERRDQGDCPDEPMKLTFEQLRLCHIRAIRQGEPLVPNAEGSTYPVLKSQMASVAGNGSITDAHLLMSLFWNTVERTPNRTMGEAWKLACNITDKEAKKQEALAASASKSPLLSLMDPATQEEWRAIESAFPTQRKREVFDKLQAGAPLSRKEGKEAQAQIIGAARSIMGASSDITPQTVFKYVAPSMKAQKVDADLVWSIIVDEHQTARRKVVDKAEVYADSWPLVLSAGRSNLYIHIPETKSYKRVHDMTKIAQYNRHTATGLEAMGIEAPLWDAKTQNEFLTKYSAQYERHIHRSGQVGATYDPITETLSEGVHGFSKKLVPAFHKEVDIWLRKLGGEDAETLLDWLAVAPNVRADALPALYIEGPKGAGKSMLIQGLAMMFESGNPVDYMSVGADFNEDLVNCPIISADEGIKVHTRDKAAASKVFRNLTGNDRHKIRRKGLKESDLHGYLRVLITANDSFGVDFGVGVGAEGMDAINERIIYLRVEQEVSQYLIDLGGRAGTRDWVSSGDNVPGRIAQHVYYLYQNREVGTYPGGRFRVVGRVTPWHDNLKRSSNAVQELLRSLCEAMKAIQNGKPIPEFDAAIKGDTLFITRAALNKARSGFGTQDKKGVTQHMLQQASGATDAISGCRIGKPVKEGGRTRRSQRKAWPIPLEELIKTEFLTEEDLNEMRGTFKFGIDNNNK